MTTRAKLRAASACESSGIWVAGHGHDVGDPARFENADVAAAEEFGGGSGGGAQCPGGVDACGDHGLEFEVAVRERERPAVGSVGDLDVASGDQAVGMLCSAWRGNLAAV